MCAIGLVAALIQYALGQDEQQISVPCVECYLFWCQYVRLYGRRTDHGQEASDMCYEGLHARWYHDKADALAEQRVTGEEAEREEERNKEDRAAAAGREGSQATQNDAPRQKAFSFEDVGW